MVVNLRTPTDQDRIVAVSILAAMTALFLGVVAVHRYVDPDLWHAMSLFREALSIGRLPTSDVFAYTPTVDPSIHHEWGTGAVLYLTAAHTGAPGVLVLRYLLAAGIGVCCVVVALRRGASVPVLGALLPLGILLSWVGFSPVRAQMFTLLMLAILLLCLDQDRNGHRRWIAPWLVLWVLWLNLHAGFVVGLILLGAHGLEQLVRRRPIAHLMALGMALIALIAVNPYGLAYYGYLWRAVPMERPLVTEWLPLWHAWPPLVAAYAFSVLVIVYAIYRNGIRQMPGLLIVALTAFAALQHARHLSLFAVAWICYVPAFVQTTPAGTLVASLAVRKRTAVLVLCALVGIASTVGGLRQRPWRLLVPANPQEGPLVYPAGAVSYLDSVEFRGNLMVTFSAGAFVSWKLYPDVKVSLDGRYEVAYQPGVLEAHVTFYDATPGWEEILDRYPTDLVLVPKGKAVAQLMPELRGWTNVYRDDVFEIYAQRDRDLPPVDRTGQRLVAAFP
jgi:hypothetical protein